MQWSSLISKQNLMLAWRRINTGRNLQYKRFFREAYLVYESAVDDNLRELRQTLKAGMWAPTHATRIYLPKPSGLQRPLSLLAIEDQILLQAISNIFAKKLRTKRERVELSTVFSNKLAAKDNSIFFTERWQETYGAFQKKCVSIFDDGYRWSASFDMAAYYDTISHDLLLSIASPKNKHPQTRDLVANWLQVWSADDMSAATGHGIPQGPMASDFLSEAFFLPIDLRLQKENIQYVRYVDDLRLFGKSENEVRKSAIWLEQECRHRGLIPQSAKFEIRAIRSAEEAMGSLPSIPPAQKAGSNPVGMSVKDVRRTLESAIAGRPLKVIDKTRFRYTMYRAPTDTRVLDRALMLLPRHPEHIDAFVSYFGNFAKRPRIARAALEFLETGVPYSYVRGELWHVVARLGGDSELRRGLDLAREDSKSRSDCTALSWGVMHFLMRCEREGVARLGRRLASEKPISRSLLAPIFPDREFRKGGHIVTLLRGSMMEQLAGVRELQTRNVSLNSIGLRQRDLSQTCRNSLLALGVIRRRHSTKRDWVAEMLTDLYDCQDRKIWRGLLSTEFEHASQLLVEAKARYPGKYSDWLSLQDSFNNIVVHHFFEFLKLKGLPGHSATVDKKGKLVNFGSLIADGGLFDRAYPDIASRIRDVHNRRNTLPGSHPYEQKGGSRNKWLKRGERNSLRAKLRVALNDISSIVEIHV